MIRILFICLLSIFSLAEVCLGAETICSDYPPTPGRQRTARTSGISGRFGRLRGGSGEPLVVGIDGGTESIRAGLFRADGMLVGVASAAYKTTFPRPGWAEQHPQDWWQCLGKAVRGAVSAAAAAESGGSDSGAAAEAGVASRIQAMCVDTTCCTVVALDTDGEAVRPALLWMDSRSAPQAAHIMRVCKGMPPLQVNCNGEGPLSAEWMLPKSMWLKENDPDTWAKAHTICEYQDFINWKLTGRLCASSCNTAARWHWDADAAISSKKDQTSQKEQSEPSPPPSPSSAAAAGRPLELLSRLGMTELADKWPQECVGMGGVIGGLTAAAADHLGLRTGLLVAQGGPDAFVGMLGLGAT